LGGKRKRELGGKRTSLLGGSSYTFRGKNGIGEEVAAKHLPPLAKRKEGGKGLGIGTGQKPFMFSAKQMSGDAINEGEETENIRKKKREGKKHIESISHDRTWRRWEKRSK